MKKSILLLITTIMLLCVSCVSKDTGKTQDEPATSKNDNVENNTTDEDGTIDDIPSDTLEKLREMGWIE